ncbi:MAG: mannose-6-phosphate isomerase [Alphaproteobacteria bacterium PA4]|nr:MAG: mannose-6-phosphate isomerase [Alphaproteobacteria bacterium PA4]
MPALQRRLIVKPWGRDQLPPGFPHTGGVRIGEIAHDLPAGVAAPLLVKHIFTAERLSVQVHPDDALARAHGEAGGKAECWLVLAADPGARIGIGGTRTVDAATLRAMAIDGSIIDWLHWQPVQAGDFVMVPPGTVHAIGAGVALVEIQQNRDVTYRLYDYGRDRALHLDAALAAACPAPHPAALRRHYAGGDVVLADTPYFRVRACSGAGTFDSGDRPTLVVPLAGSVAIAGTALTSGFCHLAAPGTPIALGDTGSVLLASA